MQNKRLAPSSRFTPSADADSFSLQGRTALVTGASKGIGAAVAAALDRAGARVALVARAVEALEGAASSLKNEPVVLPADLAEPDAPHRVIGEATEQLGEIDILVNNAAAAIRMPVEDSGVDDIDRLWALNVRAPMLLIAALVPSMRAKGQGSIVNLSSISGVVGTPRRAIYAATKGGIDAATRSLAVELGPSGIRVNSVAPGVVDTDLWAKNKAVPGVVEEVSGQTPLRRWSVPNDIADVIVFLASDAARFVTGETISVDGGMAKTLGLYAGPV